jgi:ribonuclease Z
VNLHERGKHYVSFCYSGDTSPQDRISELAKDVTYLIHESTFMEEKRDLANAYNHSTPMGAAKIAKAANAKNLVLVHYSNTIEGKEKEMEKEARKCFNGNVIVAKDGLKIKS